MTSGEKSFTKTGHMRRETFAHFCCGKNPRSPTGFERLEHCVMTEDSTSTNLPRDESDIESDNETD